MRCKDCIYFDPLPEAIKPGFGRCTHTKHYHFKVHYDLGEMTEEDIFKDALIYESDGSYADVQVGPDFGCIHFTLSLYMEVKNEINR